jgi:hypothetical protein
MCGGCTQVGLSGMLDCFFFHLLFVFLLTLGISQYIMERELEINPKQGNETMKRIKVKIERTKMCGGGTSYHVYLPVSAKSYYPISGYSYATQISIASEKYGKRNNYYRLADFLRTPEIDALPCGIHRYDTFKKLEKTARRLEFRLAKRAFPELRQLFKLPYLWAEWTLPSETKAVTLTLKQSKF